MTQPPIKQKFFQLQPIKLSGLDNLIEIYGKW